MKVSQEGYQQILEIARATAVCSECKEHYSADTLNVAGLLCLRCFLHQNPRLTFQGLLDPSLNYQRYVSPYDPYEVPVYLFLNPLGHAYVTKAGPGESDQASEKKSITLKYWHFPRPVEAEGKGQLKDVSEYSWSIYGDVMHDDIIILRHGSSFHGDELLFVAKRKGLAIQINRRKPMHRQILKDARTELEATATPGRMYLIDEEYKSIFKMLMCTG